jgi:radical SAM protein with 4Fe4S-binding SPASM domain
VKNGSYLEFQRKIHHGAKNNAFPLRVMFELTYRCNFRCRHCYIPQSYKKRCNGELDTGKVFSILEQLRELGCFYLGFTGGEPFMRQDAMKIFRQAKKNGFEIIIYTNGSLIDRELAEEIRRLRPNKVDITLPAFSKEAFQRITGSAGTYKKVFTAIKLLAKRKVNLGFKTCVLKENTSQIKKIQDFAASLGSLHRLADRLSARLDGSKEPYKYQTDLRPDSNSRLSSCIAPVGAEDHRSGKNRPKPRFASDSLFKCGVGVSQAAITPFGELKMCLKIDHPKYRILGIPPGHSQNGLKAAWEKLRGFVTSIKPDQNYKCDNCELEPYCQWCPARGWLYNRKFTSCDPQCRLRAEESRLLLHS